MRVGFLLFFLMMISQVAAAQLDSMRVVVIGGTGYQGNDKTKEFVLNRELTYQNGDTLTIHELYQKVTRSRENIFNTGLFNKVLPEIRISDSGVVSIDYQLEERWYVWPYPILENGDRNFNTWWQTKDFNRLTYGINLNWYNFRGRNETLEFLGKVGFENQFSIGYKIPNLNKKRTLGLAVAAGYSEFREVNYTSVNNKRVFYKSEDGPGRQVTFGRVRLTYRKTLNWYHSIAAMYNRIEIDTAIQSLSSDYLKNNASETEYFTLNYYGKYDTRDYIDYPLKGYKVEMYVTQYGLGILSNENLNLLTATGGVFWHVPLSERWFFANSLVGKLSFFDDPPYSLQQGLGYRNTIRGYELYVMDAQNYGIAKTNLKFTLVKRKDFHLKWLKIEKFNKPYFSMYLNAYFDVGYASDNLYAEKNVLSNKWAYGYGMGLDVVAFYDFVMRLEYSFNRENESGFFLHFKKAI